MKWWLPLSAASLVLAEQGSWTFEKISRFDRKAEPVAAGMPFPKGALPERLALHLSGGTRDVPIQTRVTSRWPDGSARWVLVRSLIDLPGNRSAQYQWSIGPHAARPVVSRIKITTEADGSLLVDNGAIRKRIPSSGFLPFADSGMNGFVIRADGRSWSTAGAGPVKLEVIEGGPLAAVISVKGRHGQEGCPFDFQATLTFWADKPYVALDYRVLAMRGGKDVPVASWDWSTAMSGPAPRLRLMGGSRLQEGTSRLAFSFGPQDFRYESNEHAFQSFWGDFWCDWTGAASGLAVTLRHAQQQFPKSMEAAPEGLRISFGQSLAFPYGAAKSHEMLFHFHPAELKTEELAVRSLQFQIPDVPKLDAALYARSGVFEERVFEGPRSRRIDALVYDVLDNRPVGVGVWNFGDEVEWGYTGQGRGRDEVVWLNNEYDFAHVLFVMYARAGERRFLDYAAANARHWRDVDIAHAAADPYRLGGHIAHSARHVTGGVTPSHQWVEGLLDAWHFFGDEAARDAAFAVAGNILRSIERPAYRDPGNSSTRDMGWALRAMLAMWRETGDDKYLEPCRRIAGFFRRWHADYPGLLAPYTQHSMVRVNFMNALTLVSLSRYLRHFPDAELQRMVLAETEDMIRNGRNANDLFYYKELPSLKHQSSTVLPLEALAHAFELSKERRFLEAGLPELEHLLLNMNARLFVHTGAAEKFATESGGYSRVLIYPPGGKFAGIGLLPLLEFLHAANDPVLARQLDYQLKLQ